GIAEAMESRAYGSGSRTSYEEYLFRLRDFVTLFLSSGILVSTIFGNVSGFTSFSYYPALEAKLTAQSIVFLALPVLFCGAVALVSSIWKINWFRARI
ncbi:MAG: hypothetical protein PHP64_07335, partial [Actinomycetota bacterium]|nr:hypothetical protein [Actinomycetota bacterium]